MCVLYSYFFGLTVCKAYHIYFCNLHTFFNDSLCLKDVNTTFQDIILYVRLWLGKLHLHTTEKEVNCVREMWFLYAVSCNSLSINVQKLCNSSPQEIVSSIRKTGLCNSDVWGKELILLIYELQLNNWVHTAFSHSQIS